MLHTHITLLRDFRVSALISAGLLAVLAGLFFFPTASMEQTKATNIISETTLSMTTENISLPLSVSNPNGTFSASTPAEVTVSTNNYTGYTLSIGAKEDNADYSKLVFGEYAFNSISSASSQNDFNNGTWGYKPSKINSSANADYLPAPTYAGDTMDVTAAANNEANSYSIALAAKADYTMPAGIYSNTFVITAVGNPVGYQITYDDNTEDEVTNMPSAQTGDVTATEVTIASETPERSGYTFDGWHNDATNTDYQPGDVISLSQTELNDIILKATWKETSKDWLDTGPNIKNKLHIISGGTGYDNYTIKEILLADSLPANFVPSDDNTISLATSSIPVYAWFDNTDNKGIIYIFSNGLPIIANENMSMTFSNFKSLKDISGVSGWDMSNVTNMDWMFSNTEALTDIDDLIDWNISNVKSTEGMFSHSGITNIDGAVNWDVSSIENMHMMFCYARSLVDLSGAADWITSSLTDMSSMFDNTAITDIDDLAGWDTSNVTNMELVFSEARSITNIDGAINWNTSKVTSMYEMFNYATALTNIDGAINWDTSNVENMTGMLRDTDVLADIDGATYWNTSKVKTMDLMFTYATSITNLDALSTGVRQGKDYVSWDVSNVTSMSGMFYYTDQLANINGITNWNTSKVSDMSGMFDKTKITNLDALSTGVRQGNDYVSWDVSNVTNMEGMFSHASNIASLQPLYDWNVSNLLDMDGMFDGIPTTVERPTWYQE